MLKTNYSTAVILMAANVLDGGKQLSDVPSAFQASVSELIEASTAKPAEPSTAAKVSSATAGGAVVVTPKEA